MVFTTNNDDYFSSTLINWYLINRRILPWRNTTDPYIIWISEIILQQTRVAQGLDYFNRFIHRFPDVFSLANADEDEILKYWQGLGYYSRARNLHAAARTIVETYHGVFPKTFAEIKSLKGIGDYTAAAIASFAWNLPHAVVDGNVYRILSRLFAIDTPIDTTTGKKVFAELAAELLPDDQPGLYNQAIMDFGALQCIPQNPDCNICPLMNHCLAFARNAVQSFPVKQGKTKTRNRYFYFFHIIKGDNTWIQKRNQNDIWKGLYQFPLIETEQQCDWIQLQKLDEFKRLFNECGKIKVNLISPEIKHILSHQKLFATFLQVEVESKGDLSSFCQEIKGEELDKYAVPKLILRYLNDIM